MTSKWEGAIGLCLRARQCVSGVYAVQMAVKKGEAYLVLLDPDTAPQSRDAMDSLCRAAGVPLRTLPEAGVIAHLTSKANRKFLAVVDRQFALMIEAQLPQDKI